MSGLVDKLLDLVRGRPADPATRLRAEADLSYEEAKELARHKDPEVRRTLAARPDLRPEILYYLAEDPHPDVRRQIAANQATPIQADLRLAADIDPSVRGDLAAKIARLAPGLSADEQDRLRLMTYEALALLARDQITRVRQILAEALKDVANAPPELIRALAHDSELAVSNPVLQFSPVLSDEDLLEIINSSPINGKLTAISKRQDVKAPVADAIARSDDIDAIAVLLANPSAQIREETLDMLLDRAPDHETWHGPLVRRPQLSARAATRLARFVAESLLQVLQERPDLDPETKAAVAAVVRRRVEEVGSDMADFQRGVSAPQFQQSVGEGPMEVAERLLKAGQLEEPAIMSAIASGDEDFVAAALATRSSLPFALAQKIITTRSAKGMTALVWRARLGMSIAVLAQIRLAKIAPSDVIRPKSGSHAFPLTAEEMNWQIEFFQTMVSGTTKPKQPV
ncbi:MAG TPA: DUF2336 domain-containing protein [Candidatus Sulfotelmatobacter sp.]|jgi:uncharacterized protein (DUF2336 family)|nr:DUF2336 domain-containing protein [Candidatus Sulfotelmatobacter sp.]